MGAEGERHVEIVEEPGHARTQKGSPERRVLGFGGSRRLNALEWHIDDGIGGVQQADERDERGNGGGKEDPLQNGHRGRKGSQKHVEEHRTQQLVVTNEDGEYPAAALKQQENRPCRRRIRRVWT